MASERTYLAVDLGASSGRVLAGKFDGSRLTLEETFRFPNGPVRAGGHSYWDLLRLWSDIQTGLRSAAQAGSDIVSLGVDTWGVDFALLGRNDELLGNPYHYRDPHTRGMMEEVLQMVGREVIFAETGLQFMEINTLYQLYAMSKVQSSLLEAAQTFFMMPDLFHWLLTGEKANEFTDASTSQFLNPSSRQWSRDLLQRLSIPTDMLQSIINPGTDLGPLRGEVAKETGLASVKVVVPGTHDTASAVMAVPAAGEPGQRPDWCYISSGTWSLMGAEVAEPNVSDACRELNFTNEGGVGGTIRLLKNITGLWLVQECRRVWALEGRDFDWNQLTEMADQAPPLKALINPDDPCFLAPDNMADAIRSFCQRTGQPVPSSEGEIIRCALESLALRCRVVFDWLQRLTGTTVNVVHIVGGGTQNRQLCQMTADACNCVVLAGPVEATAIGNVMVQAIADGQVESVQQARQVIANSFPLDRYEPGDPRQWEDAFGRFQQLTQS